MKSYFSSALSTHKTLYSHRCSACFDLFFFFHQKQKYGISTQDHTWVLWKSHRRTDGNWIRINMCCRNHSCGSILKLESVGLHKTELCAGLPLPAPQPGVGRGRVRAVDLYTYIQLLKLIPKHQYERQYHCFQAALAAIAFHLSSSGGQFSIPCIDDFCAEREKQSPSYVFAPQRIAENTLILKNFFSSLLSVWAKLQCP